MGKESEKEIKRLIELNLIKKNKNSRNYSFDDKLIRELINFHNKRVNVFFNHFLSLVKPEKNRIDIDYSIENFGGNSEFKDYPEFYKIKLNKNKVSKKKRKKYELDLCVNPALRIMRYIEEHKED